MGFRKVPIDPNTRVEIEYINTNVGIKKEDGIVLIFRPLTLDEIENFDSRTGGALRYKRNRQVGKGGFRDRANDPRSEIVYTPDSPQLTEIRHDKVRAALIDWRGFEDQQGNSIPFSWDAFLEFCRMLPDLMEAAIEWVDDVNVIALGRLREIRESEKNSQPGPSTGSAV